MSRALRLLPRTLKVPATRAVSIGHGSEELDPARLLSTRRVGPPLERPDAPVRLLIVWHSRTGMAKQMATALQHGAQSVAREFSQEDDIAIQFQRAADTQVDDLLQSHGYLFCAPENLASVPGEMKEFFDRCYYGALGRICGRPYGLAIAGGTDGEGATRQLARICQGWRLRKSADPLIVRNGAQTPQAIAAPKSCGLGELARCQELGGLVAAQLLMAI